MELRQYSGVTCARARWDQAGLHQRELHQVNVETFEEHNTRMHHHQVVEQKHQPETKNKHGGQRYRQVIQLAKQEALKDGRIENIEDDHNR